jgi:hypothetical protein
MGVLNLSDFENDILHVVHTLKKTFSEIFMNSFVHGDGESDNFSPNIVLKDVHGSVKTRDFRYSH